METGEETYLVLQAATLQEAEEIARAQGLMIAGVRDATPADWGAPPLEAPALAIPVYSPVPETIVFESVHSQEGKVTERGARVTPWSELEEAAPAAKPVARAQPEPVADPAAKPVAAVRAVPTAQPFDLVDPPAVAAHVGSVFSDGDVPITKDSESTADPSTIPLAESGQSPHVAVEARAKNVEHIAPEPYGVPASEPVPVVATTRERLDGELRAELMPAHVKAPAMETSDALASAPLMKATPVETPVVTAAPRTTPGKPVAPSDDAHRSVTPAAAAPPAAKPPQTARTAPPAPQVPAKPGVPPIKKTTSPVSRGAQGSTPARPGQTASPQAVPAAPAARSALAARPADMPLAPAPRAKRPQKSTSGPIRRVLPPPAAAAVAEHAPPVVEQVSPPAEPLALVVEPMVGSGMEQVVTKLALDQTAQHVEHSAGSALERLTGLDEHPTYSSGAAHAAEYGSNSFAAPAQQAAPPVATAAPSAPAPDDVPIAWVAAPAPPASPPRPVQAPGGTSYVTLFVCPIAFLMFAGGAGLLAYGMLRNVDPGDNEMLKLDLRLQSLTYCLLGGFLLIGGLLGFVAAGMAHLAGAVRRSRAAG
jgi:hypothetical protein